MYIPEIPPFIFQEIRISLWESKEFGQDKKKQD
jgi:hypothetical protein